MFSEEFLENYKLTTEYIKDTFRVKILEAFKGLNVPEDQQEMMMSVSLATPKIVETMNNYPAIIYSMFDNEKLFYSTTMHPSEKSKSFFYVKVENGEIVESPTGYNSRRDAEYGALFDALYKMEELLAAKVELK